MDPGTASIIGAGISGLFGSGGGGDSSIRPEQAPQFEEMLKLLIPTLQNQIKELAAYDPVRAAAVQQLVAQLQGDNRYQVLQGFLEQAKASGLEGARQAGAAPGVTQGERTAMEWDAQNKAQKSTNDLATKMSTPEYDFERLQTLLGATGLGMSVPSLGIGQSLQRSATASSSGGGPQAPSAGLGDAIGAGLGLLGKFGSTPSSGGSKANPNQYSTPIGPTQFDPRNLMSGWGAAV